jgi:peptide/nickel transport system permease protein
MAESLSEAESRIEPSTRRIVFRDGTGSVIAGGIAFFGIVLVALLASVIAPHPNAIAAAPSLASPSWGHLMGTDDTSRDILARVLDAARVDLLIAVLGALISFGIGSVTGLFLGYFRGKGSELMMRVLDVVQAFPLLVFGLALVSFLAPRFGVTPMLIVAVAFVSIPVFIRLVRSETLAVAEMPFVEAARSVGNPTWRVVLRHVLPNVLTSSLVQLTTTAGYAILTVGALSFVGVGVQPPRAEWGLMILQGSQVMVTGQWWPSIFPGVALFVTVLSLHMMGEGFVRLRSVR